MEDKKRLFSLIKCCGFLMIPLMIFYAFFQNYKDRKELKELEERVAHMDHLLSSSAAQKKVEQLYIHRLQESSQDYLKEKTEQLEFLASEGDFIQGHLPLHFLSSLNHKTPPSENQCTWDLVSQKESGEVVETIYQLNYPVEVDLTDLKTVLSILEDDTQEKPDLTISKFSLEKKTSVSNRETFLVDIELIQRAVKK